MLCVCDQESVEPSGNRHGNREEGESAASPAGAYATLQARSDEPSSTRSLRACAKHGSENLPLPRPSSSSPRPCTKPPLAFENGESRTGPADRGCRVAQPHQLSFVNSDL